MSINAYPLHWPQVFPRATRRDGGGFKTTLSGALTNVEESLRLFARDSEKRIEGLVISSNVTLGAQRPSDPGVAVWFTWDGLQVCIPVDRYSSVEANLQAIHHIIEARRVELRHGTLALVRASFTGFKALPAPGNSTSRGWREVLGVDPTENDLAKVRERYRKLSAIHHPDKGGRADAMAELNWAWAQAQETLK